MAPMMNTSPALPEATRPALPAASSARIETRSQSAPFTPEVNPPAQSVKKADSLPSDNPPVAAPPVAGAELPEIDGIQWEHKTDGSIEAWHSPEVKRNRAGKTYLGRLGVRRLAELFAIEEGDRAAQVAAWICEKRKAKGIE